MAEAAAPTTRPQGEVRLDDLMLAMDVVDTLRRQDAFLARELDEEGREEELKSRLRRIYREQGIEVSDAVIDEGVNALKDARFVYAPPRPGLSRALALLWVSRRKAGIFLAAAFVLAAALLGGFLLLRERKVESIRIEHLTGAPSAPAGARASGDQSGTRA
ncbi:DUF6384 family protein [Methylocella sp.]|uniref:DUF6384 family protein n=1 Tax=Methylocella sp. TaxID=1978226 RepID=UPI0035B3F688